MNILFKYFIFFALVSSLYTNANECSSIIFEGDVDNNYVVELFAVNTKIVDHVDNYTKHQARSIVNEEYAHYFQKGDYSLLLRVWDKSFFKIINSIKTTNHKIRTKKFKQAIRAFYANRYGKIHSGSQKYKQNENILSQFLHEIPVEVSLESNSAYKITLSKLNEGYTFSESQKKQSQCPNDNIDLFSTESTLQINANLLPDTLQLKLNNLMGNLGEFYEMQDRPSKNIVKAGAYQYFGAVLSNELTKDGYYKVLAVHPYSLADKMGLIAGDLILSMGEIKKKKLPEHPNDSLTQYLASNKHNQFIDLKVARINQVLNLRHPYSTTLIPQSSYSIGDSIKGNENVITKSQNIPKALAFEYDQTILEISKFYAEKLHDSNIEIVGTPTFTKQYGMKGKVITKTNIIGMLITEVLPNTTASQIGIKAGDLIHRINDIKMNDKSRPFAQVIANLSNEQAHKVLITREGKLLTLEGKTAFAQQQAFKLKLLSLNMMKKLTKKRKAPRRFARYPNRYFAIPKMNNAGSGSMPNDSARNALPRAPARSN